MIFELSIIIGIGLLLLAFDGAVHGPQLSDVRTALARALEELGVSEMVAPRLRAPHGVRIAHGDVGSRRDVYTSAENLKHVQMLVTAKKGN